jgi:hypothetical protein
MELECWTALSAAISSIAARIKGRPRDTYSTAWVLRVYLWAVLHDRPVDWACDRRNWNPRACPAVLPDQSTMSRRTRRGDFEPALAKLYQRLSGTPHDPSSLVLRVVDGKPLELPNHTTDRDAAWGRGVSRQSVGYKLHAIWSDRTLPEAFVVTPLDRCEKQMAARMIRRIDAHGYLLGDAHYNASWLFDVCHQNGHRLLCPRVKPGTGQGHRYQSPQRLRTIDQMESPGRLSLFGPTLYHQRRDIERRFGTLASTAGGLAALPSWVRRIWRVRHWVYAKLLIHAARPKPRRLRA